MFGFIFDLPSKMVQLETSWRWRNVESYSSVVTLRARTFDQFSSSDVETSARFFLPNIKNKSENERIEKGGTTYRREEEKRRRTGSERSSFV